MNRKMNKFFIMTRGRTGSTAIVDVLSKFKGICTSKEQELFLQHDFPQIKNNFSNLKGYPSTLPFELWKSVMPQWRNFLLRLRKNWLIDAYLEEAERLALDEKAGAFGFKVLSNHFESNPSLVNVLLERGYRAIYLKRNVPHQVISGMIANKRGVFNAKKDYQDDNRYRLDVEEFKNLLLWETQAVENDISFLKDGGFEFIEVSYEEFMADRQMFFDKVLGFLDLPSGLPQESLYSVMIKDLRHTVENYQALVDSATSMGMRIE